jgi:hypothetical protein
MKWTGDEGGREQYTRRFIADGDTSIGTGSVSRAKQQAGGTDGQNAGQAATKQASPDDGNGTAGNVRNDNRGSSASQLADISRVLIAHRQPLTVAIMTGLGFCIALILSINI